MLQDLYPYLLAFHNLLRWIVLAAAVIATFYALSGWSGKKAAAPGLLRLALIFVIAMDLQFLAGLILYFGASPITRLAFADFGAAMKSHEPRFFAVEHTTMMFLALVCAHLGGIFSRKAANEQRKFRLAAVAWAFSIALMLSGMPWWRPFLRLPG